MFENMNPLDRSTAFFEIAVLLLISFIIGFIAARIPIKESVVKNENRNKNKPNSGNAEVIDPRDIITEPTTIKAVLTRDRKGNAIAPLKTVQTRSVKTPHKESPPTRIAAIKKDYSKKATKNAKNKKNSTDN